MSDTTEQPAPTGSRAPTRAIEVAVLLPDPRKPYDFAKDGTLGEMDTEAVQRLEEALGSLAGYRATLLDDHEQFIDRLREGGFDIALNFCDTGYYNQDLVGNVPSLCEILRIPCTGAPAWGLDAASDKWLVGALATSLGIPAPAEQFVDLTAESFPAPRTYPALIKPNVGGGSYGVTRRSVAHDADEAERYLRWLAETIAPPEALIQEFLTGAEYTVSVIGNPPEDLVVLPPAEVDYSRLDPDLPPIFPYAGKFEPGSRYWEQLRHRRAVLDTTTLGWLKKACRLLFARLRCRDYARFDFRADENGVLKLLDANPNPTWHWDGRLALSAGWAGHDYAGLLRMILEAAAARYPERMRQAPTGPATS